MLRRTAIAMFAALVVALSLTLAGQEPEGNAYGIVKKLGVDLDLRSLGRQLADDIASGLGLPDDEASPVPGIDVVPGIHLRGPNVQVNAASLDNIQTFPARRPFVLYTQSETSIAGYGRNLVAAYNSSANQTFQLIGATLFQTSAFLSGFSSSSDGGATWTSGFFPPLSGSQFTFGDPVVAKDRDGNFYFSGLGANASGAATIQVNKSTDGGRTWSPAVLVQQDNGGDKEWLAVGPDPVVDRDNIYVTWTSFQATGAQLRFGRSFDGGTTWATKTIFAPPADPNPANPQNSLQFSNTYVDPITGRLYIPFLHFSNSDADFIRILVSDDAGETFSFLPFNVPGAPSPTLLPAVQAGTLTDCGSSGGLRLTIQAGPNIGGRFGFPSYEHATRLTLQPAFAARNGVLYMAWSQSTGTVFGANVPSEIVFMRSDDGGQSWSAPLRVNPGVATDAQHVLPALAIDADPNDVHVTYYTQHTDGTVDLDMANSHDRGNSFPANRTVRVTSTSFPLAPTNVRLSPPAGGVYNTTNYDRTIRPCYMLGEYQSVAYANGTQYVAWGDGRNTVTQPVNALDPISGQTHAQTDVFFQKVKAN